MRYVAGIKRTVIIDDTYNSAPRSLDAALAVLGEMPVAEDAKRFAVLGDMLELGPMTETAHREAGRKAASRADILVLVGERMADAEKGAIEAGAGEERVFHFSTPEEAGRFVQERMKKDDVILVKGSRGMHMEKVVKEIMADPLAAGTLLVKEHDEWKW
jgi:UDP-N-acetylmuramoyl-tripeptide--D-alanyl-D-alanine ligase